MIRVKNSRGEIRDGKVLYQTEAKIVCCKFDEPLQEKSPTMLFYFNLETGQQVSWECGRLKTIQGWNIQEVSN